MEFHIVASTGRTATTFIAATLDQLDFVAACHEGYAGARKELGPTLPLINLENRQAYLDPKKAHAVVSAKRDAATLSAVARNLGADILFDVAYYNPVFCQAILDLHPCSRMVGVIRDCEGFVRSATTVKGEDKLPVGWPAPDKPLSQREAFIQLGRIKPRPGTAEAEAWSSWTAIQRNIWLWQETNLLLLEAESKFGDRVRILDLAQLKNSPGTFWNALGSHFELSLTSPEQIEKSFINKKDRGYQVGPMESWSQAEQRLAAQATEKVGYPIQ